MEQVKINEYSQSYHLINSLNLQKLFSSTLIMGNEKRKTMKYCTYAKLVGKKHMKKQHNHKSTAENKQHMV